MKRIHVLLLPLVLIITSLMPFSAYAAETIATQSELNSAFENGGEYTLGADFGMLSTAIKGNLKINGNSHELRNLVSGSDSMFYQNDYAVSEFSDLKITGSSKKEIGIWLGAGQMTFNNCTVRDFIISTVRQAAIGVAGSAKLVLNGSKLMANSDYDLYLTDSASVDINSSSIVKKIWAASTAVKLNIGAGWAGTASITFTSPVQRVIGTVGEGADISGIKVTNEGFRLENADGKLMLKSEGETALHFDMSQRETLYKGSTGFLYGAAEINVPSVDLLYGLQPDTMVQKAYGGLQHPTGDAVRTSSALLSAGVKDMQIYLQDHYLEWPYDAPYKNGTIDLDAYQKTVEEIIYGMICDEVSSDTEGAFRGSDGKYYRLNSNSENYSYVLFNEPDQIWYGGNLEGLKAAWKKIYTAVHNIDPSARCVGPNFSGFNEAAYDSFLSFCKDNGCLPEIISWHELGDISMTDYYAHYESVKAMQAKYYIGDFQPQLMVNEYARHYDIGSPGGLVKWLAMFEDKDMSGCMAYWAMANTLNEMAADQNSPTSTWWVYHWYAQMTGKQCPLTAPEFSKSRFWGVTSYDEDINTAYSLFGGNENRNGNEAVYLDNLDSTDLLNDNSCAHVKLYAVSFSGQLGSNYKPQVVFDGAVKANENTLKLYIDGTDEMQAYFAVITKEKDGVNAEELSALTYPVTSYEAEDAALIGGATAYEKNGWATFAASGRAEVGNINNVGDGVTFKVDIPESGEYIASLFYSLQAPFVDPKTLVPDNNGQNRGIGKSLAYSVEINGKQFGIITLESTVTWSYRRHYDLKLNLSAGQHKITFRHINGDERSRGNLQLVAALDKLDISKLDENENDFEVFLSEMKSFKTDNGWRITAVAPNAGYYTISSDGNISIKKQCIDYAKSADSKEKISVYDSDVSDTVYLAQGANTLLVSGNADRLAFAYKGNSSSLAVNSSQFTLHGNRPTLKANKYADSGYTVSELGIGQSPEKNDKGEYNYLTFKVNAKSAGLYNFGIRYTNNEPAPIMLKADGSTYIHPYNIDLVERYAQISVNGAEPETVYFKNTLSLDTFRTLDVQLRLNEGENTIKIYNDNSYQFSSLVNSTAPEIDCITVSPLSYTEEKAELIAGDKSSTHSFKTNSETKAAATLTADGKITRDLTCSICGYHTVKTEVIPKISSVKLSKTKFTYSGKSIKPSVTVYDSEGKAIPDSAYTVSYANNKKIGTAKVTVSFSGDYSGVKALSFTINPKGTRLTKLTAGKKKASVKWAKNKTVSGYEIQYSLKKNMKSAKTKTAKKVKTTKLTVKKLKSKKVYYIRIRTYKTVGGRKYYSSWSKVKKVKTK